MSRLHRHAFAYRTGNPLVGFAKKKTPDMKDALLRHLHTQPWLRILDGLG